MTMTNNWSVVTGGLQSYCSKIYLRSNINQMWKTQDLLDNFQSRSFWKTAYVQTVEFPPL